MFRRPTSVNAVYICRPWITRWRYCGWTLTSAMFTSEDLRALCRYDVRPARPVRKAIFSLRLWRPARQRLHQQRLRHSASAHGQRQATDNGVALGCVNARSVGNKAATLCRIITDEHLDILAITETWHECSESTVLKRVTPLGYNCIDAARPIPPRRAP